MSEFEFVQITFAIILGLGVTSLLASIADQLKNRRSKPLFPLQLSAQSVLLLLIFIQLWGFWAARDIEWNILLFLLHALSPICYAIAAYSSGVELDNASPSIDKQYFFEQPSRLRFLGTGFPFRYWSHVLLHQDAQRCIDRSASLGATTRVRFCPITYSNNQQAPPGSLVLSQFITFNLRAYTLFILPRTRVVSRK